MTLSGAYHSSNMYSASENSLLQNTGRTGEKPVLVSINAFQLILFMSHSTLSVGLFGFLQPWAAKLEGVQPRAACRATRGHFMGGCWPWVPVLCQHSPSLLCGLVTAMKLHCDLASFSHKTANHFPCMLPGEHKAGWLHCPGAVWSEKVHSTKPHHKTKS